MSIASRIAGDTFNFPEAPFVNCAVALISALPFVFSQVDDAEDRVWRYRPDEELDAWIEKDQLARLAGMIDDLTRGEIEAEVEAEIAAAIVFAERSSFPGDEELLKDIFHE